MHEIFVFLIIWIFIQLIILILPRLFRFQVDSKTYGIFFWIHFVLLIFTVVQIILFSYSFSIRGMTCDRLITWLFIISGILIEIIARNNSYRRFFYFRLLKFLPIIIISTSVIIPFYGIAVTSRISGFLFPIYSKIIYENQEYRVEYLYSNPIIDYQVTLDRKEGIFEKEIYYAPAHDVTQCKIKKLDDKLLFEYIENHSPQVVLSSGENGLLNGKMSINEGKDTIKNILEK